jgi:hypothetical protein
MDLRLNLLAEAQQGNESPERQVQRIDAAIAATTRAADRKSEHRDCNEPHPSAASNGRRLRNCWSWRNDGRHNAGFSAGRVQRCNEAVPPAGQRLHIARLIGGVVQCRPQALDCRVQAVFEIDKCIRWPELFLQLLARDRFPRPLQQHLQDRERLALQTNADSRLAQLLCMRRELVDAKTRDFRPGLERERCSSVRSADWYIEYERQLT